jgi:hypothetical protein
MRLNINNIQQTGERPCYSKKKSEVIEDD